MSSAHVYFDFLLLCQKNQSTLNNHRGHVSLHMLALFLLIARKHAANETMTISQAMAQRYLASSATLHARIDDLREAGMVCIRLKQGDKRTKYLIPSEKGERYLALMGQLLLESRNAKNKL